MQCAYIVFPIVAYSALQYFCTLSNKRYDFRGRGERRGGWGGEVIERKMCFDYLYNFYRNIYRSKKTPAGYEQIRTLVFM
jgi:hypothetical protein